MDIVVVGAGALGSLIGALLSRENEVALVGRKAHVDEISRGGLVLEGLTDGTFHIRASSSLPYTQPDLAVLCVKAYDTAAAAREIAAMGWIGTMLLSLQNGLGNEDTLADVVPDLPVIGGITSVGANIVHPGTVHHGGDGETIIGAYARCDEHHVTMVADAFTTSGIPISTTDRISTELWAKVIVNAGINPITAIHGIRNGGILESRDLQDQLGHLCEEGVNVANAVGAELSQGEMLQRALDVVKRTATNRSSMLQDVQMGRRTEIDQINGAIVREGAERGVPTPFNLAVIDQVKGLSGSGRPLQ